MTTPQEPARIGDETKAARAPSPTVPSAVVRLLLKNYRSGIPAPLWQGDIDYRHAVGLMRAAGFAGWVSIEGDFGDVGELQAQGLRSLRGLNAP